MNKRKSSLGRNCLHTLSMSLPFCLLWGWLLANNLWLLQKKNHKIPEIRNIRTAQKIWNSPNVGRNKEQSQKSHPKYPLVIKEHVKEVLTVPFERSAWFWKEKAHKFDRDTWWQNNLITPFKYTTVISEGF